jgi:ribosomal protein L11 methyltransferase
MSSESIAAEPRYPFVAVDASPDQADEIGAALFELGATGVEERDAGTLVRGAAAGKVTLVGSFDSREEADAAVAALVEAVPDGAPRVEEVVGDAWRDAWKEHFAPFALTPHVTVVPPWVEDPPPLAPGAMRLVLEPGRAFGTGLHATTSLVAEILDASRASLAGREVLDMGTGSGILALAALLLGASRALAVDVDPDVIEVVRENAARNALADRVDARAGTAASVTGTFPWVLANIEARVLRPIAPDLARLVSPGGALVLSGILESEHDEMVRIYGALGLRHTETRRRGDAGGEGWVALAFTSLRSSASPSTPSPRDPPPCPPTPRPTSPASTASAPATASSSSTRTAPSRPTPRSPPPTAAP